MFSRGKKEKLVSSNISNDASDARGSSRSENSIYVSPDLVDRNQLEMLYPVMDSMAFEDKVFSSGMYSESEINLSKRQQETFHSWVRPQDVLQLPTVAAQVRGSTVVQHVISDCSLVASMAACANHQAKFHSKLISNSIFPHNNQDEPVFNPCGKYIVKLHFYGAARRVVIDDRLPVSKRGSLLCSHTLVENELWVSLLEKAYVKIMGGYDFPGSNSNIDLYTLTGWIPERMAVSQLNSSSSDLERILHGFQNGKCLATIATGPLTPKEEDKYGIASSHSYAVLEMKKLKSMNLILFQLKNPWCHMQWKGPYSDFDTVHWTAELQEKLHDCRNTGKGVFWIDFKSLVRHFDVLFVNWSPDLFFYCNCIHSVYPNIGPHMKNDRVIASCPQFVIRCSCSEIIWILLTCHSADKREFISKQKYISMNIYDVKGMKIHQLYDATPILEGIRINSPHFLLKLLAERSRVYTAVILQQYQQNYCPYFTISVYSNSPVNFKQL